MMALRKKRPQTEDPPVSDLSAVSSGEIVAEAAGEALPSDDAAGDAESSAASDDSSVTQEPPTSGPKGFTVAAVVQFRGGPGESWKEGTQIKTISKNGAGLLLTREVPVGRIISLVLGMPQELRVYDHEIPSYLMLAVVQNCVSIDVDGEPFYHVGVAFIGKEVPDAYRTDPNQCYRITGLNGQGLWEVVESANPFRPRQHLRFWSRIRVTVSILDPKTRTSRKRSVFTRDVSGGGMSAFGPTDAKVGDRVKVMSSEYNFYSMATVRHRTENENEKLSLVHFEFDDPDFPVERLAAQTNRREKRR